MIYLDFAAATPMSKKAIKAMTPFFAEDFFNPSAPYLPAKRVREIYELAKSDIARVIGAKGADLIITSGATESINLAFTAAHDDAEVIYLSTEHASVREAASVFAHAEVRVDKTGLIDLKDLKNKISDRTELISVSLANNELGTIQPIVEIASIVQDVRRQRMSSNNTRPLFLHCDASQALSLIDINVSRLGVDLMTLNAAKVYGPKGVGALYVAHGVKLKPVVRGGGQELGLRSGTENVPGVIGFATAAKDAKEHINGNRKKYETMTCKLRDILKSAKIEPIFLGNKKHQLANFCPVSFPGIDAERIIYKLEEQNIYLSTGAACAASKGEKSHTLVAIGLNNQEIAGSLRISLGMLNDQTQVETAAKAIVQSVNEEVERQNDEK